MLEMQEMRKYAFLKIPLWSGAPWKWLTRLLPVGFGIIFVSWLLAKLDFRAAAVIIRQIPPSLVLLGFGAYLAGFALRAVRFRLLLPADKPIKHLFSIVLVHYTALNIIPLRLGEVSYIYLLHKINHISTGFGVSNLIIARVFDLIAIALLFIVSALITPVSSAWLRLVTVGVSLFLFGVLAVLMLVLMTKEQCVAGLTRGLRYCGLEQYTVTRRGLRELAEIVKAFTVIQVKPQALKVFLLSVCIWLCIFGSNFLLFRAFQVDIAFLEVVIASTCIILLRFLPLQLISGVGLHEASWVVIAMAYGVPQDTAITSGFGAHIMGTAFLGLLGVIGLLRLHFGLKRYFVPDAE